MRVNILGVPIDRLTAGQAWRKMVAAATTGQRPYFVVTPNPEFLVMAHRDPQFKEVLRAADLAIPDGQGLLWAARRFGQPLPERVTGTDTVGALCRSAAVTGASVYFLGGQPGVAAAAATALKAANPDLKVAGADDGGQLEQDDQGRWRLNETAWQKLVAARPQVLFVAFGQGKQEKWLYQNLDRLPGLRLAIGIGGAFDFIAGRVPRAPAFWRKHGLEWFWRLVREPWRWRRIFRAVVVFPWLVLSSRD